MVAFFVGRWTVQPAVCAQPHADHPLLDDAKIVAEHVDGQFPGTSGEYRRAQGLRMLMNRHPEARERDCALALELAVYHP